MTTVPYNPGAGRYGGGNAGGYGGSGGPAPYHAPKPPGPASNDMGLTQEQLNQLAGSVMTPPQAGPTSPASAGHLAGQVSSLGGAAANTDAYKKALMDQRAALDATVAQGQYLNPYAATPEGVDQSQNYLGVNQSGQTMERVATPPPMDPNAFQVAGLPGMIAGYQGQHQAAQYQSALANQAAQGAQGNAMQSRNAAYNALTAPGPSVAENQLFQGQEAAARNALAMARSGRGMGSGGQLRAAQFAGQEALGAANQQAAGLRAQEEAARRQQMLALGGMDQSALGQEYQRQLSMGSLGLQALQGQGSLSLAQQQALADQAKTQAQMTGQANQTNASMFNEMRPDNTWSDIGNAAGAISGGLGGLAAMAKVLPALGVAFSDENSKTRIQALEQENAALRGDGQGTAADRFATLPSYSYEYKDPGMPGAAPGQQVGPMAQDIERVLPGAVMDTVQGKMVDPSRLVLANASATSELARRLDVLEGKKPAEDLGTLPAMQVDAPARRENLGTLPAMQVDMPRRRDDLGTLKPMTVDIPARMRALGAM